VTNLVASPLALEGWLEFNRIKWGVQPRRINLSAKGSGLPSIDAIFFLDKRGKICLPPRNPYMALFFKSTPTNAPYRLYRQWLDIADSLVKEMRNRGLASTLALPPWITDVRPWQWAGFKTGLKYTLYIKFPYDIKQARKSIQKDISKAINAGFTCEKTTDINNVFSCLLETEARQGFNHQLTLKDLELARELLGNEHFRIYVCFAPNGEPASAYIWLHLRGTWAVGWVGGSKTAYLSSGVTQFLTKFIMEDLYASGAAGIDWAGANIPGVAAAKANWGSSLAPYYTIEAYGLKQMAKWLRDWYRF